MASALASTPAAMQQAELMRRYTAFLDADDGRGALSARVREMVAAVDAETASSARAAPKRLVVSVDALRAFHAPLAAALLATPVEHLPVLERAMQDLIAGEREDFAKDRRVLSEFRVGLEGSFGGRTVSPRGLGARLVGGVVALEGIVTRATTIRPRLVVSVHYCPATGQFFDRTYKDASSVSSLAVFTQNAGMPGASVPRVDENGNPLETEFGKCWYRDFQRVTVQEMPECSPPGQLPRSVEVFCEGDLCDACKPGDRVRVVGIYRALGGGGGNGGGSGVFKTVVVANNVCSLSGTDTRGGVGSVIPMHDRDIKNIRELAGKGNVFEKLARSIAPSICGHDYIKKALLLLLVGGKERNLANGTHLRGDINVMMCGDPSTAKSQLLRFVLHTAPLALSTTGRGSSGVGLTAAVTTDPDTNERHLEAGAMVLADRGVVCIDEFDKMSDEDRVAIHEVMEQQTVTIAKAGIHASLNARCSVVAAANPVYGSYDKTRKPHENIALPDSLLSRFDLLFIVLDSNDPDRDRLIADHVLKGHRFRKATHTLDEMDDGGAGLGRSVSGSGGSAGVNVGDANGTGPVAMYETAATSLYAAQAAASAAAGRSRRSSRRSAAAAEADKILSTDFLKRYINYAKTRTSPTLSLAAAEYISESYSALRQDVDSSKTLPITARCLETLIRLATAHAKCRLDKVTVTREDAEVAVEILRFALFNQAEPDQSEKAFRKAARKKAKQAAKEANKKKNAVADGERTDSDDDEDEEDGDDTATGGGATGSGTGPTTGADESIDDDTPATGTGSPAATRRSGAGATTPGSRTRRGRGSGAGAVPLPESAEAEGGAEGDEGLNPKEASKEVKVGKEEVRRVMAAVNAARGRRGMLTLQELVEWLAEEEEVEDEDAEPLTRAQIVAGLKAMAEKDMVVLSDDNIFIAS
jgi:DNA replication licensing factor MCM3